MTNEQILKKAIEKAIKNGWYFYKDNRGGELDKKFTESLLEKNKESYYRIIFSHDFAKAFWGEKRVQFWCGQDGCGNGGEHYHERNVNWRWELQQMVSEEEPLKYIEKFL